MEYPEEFKLQLAELNKAYSALVAENNQAMRHITDDDIMKIDINSGQLSTDNNAESKSSTNSAVNKVKSAVSNYKYYIIAGVLVVLISVVGIFIYKRKK